MNICDVSTSLLVWITLLWTFVYRHLFGHMFSVVLDIYIEVNCWVVWSLCLTFLETFRFFIMMSAPVYIPSSNLWRFQFCCIFFSVCYHLDFSHPNGCEVLVCISFGNNDIEHLFICFLTTCEASLDKYKCLFRFFIHLKSWVVYNWDHVLYNFWKQAFH